MSHSCLRQLAQLAAAAKSSAACDVGRRLRGLIMVARQQPYREVAPGLSLTSGTVAYWVSSFEHQGGAGLLTKPRAGPSPELNPSGVLAARGPG